MRGFWTEEQKCHLLEPVVLARIGERLPAPQPGEYLQTLVEKLCPNLPVGRFPHLRETTVVQGPSPTGKTRRPLDKWSRATVSRASFHGLLRAGGVNTAPILTLSVRMAIAAITTHGSYVSMSPTQMPSQ